MRNRGNNAMLEAAIERLSQYWPEASFGILTDAPHITRLYFPKAYPVSPHDFSQINTRFDKLFSLLPQGLLRQILEFRETVWQYRPKIDSALRSLRGLRAGLHDVENPKHDTAELGIEDNLQMDSASYKKNICEHVADFDLIVITGGGIFYDFDTYTPLKILDRLEVAISQGIPTIMVGQGVGPIRDLELQRRSREILPSVDLIGVRNRRVGEPTLQSLGVSKERVIFTGDDAIELAYRARPKSMGTGIGLSLRVAAYTEVEEKHLERIRPVIQAAAGAHRARLIAVPISSHPEEADITYIKQVFEGYGNQLTRWRQIDKPSSSIRNAGKCRLMITGTYHGAIFSLAQGIPVITLAYSEEYVVKLSELADDFGAGCQVLYLGDKDLPEKLASVIEDLWSNAEQLRPEILKVAEEQIKLQHMAYQRVPELVASKNSLRNNL